MHLELSRLAARKPLGAKWLGGDAYRQQQPTEASKVQEETCKHKGSVKSKSNGDEAAIEMYNILVERCVFVVNSASRVGKHESTDRSRYTPKRIRV